MESVDTTDLKSVSIWSASSSLAEGTTLLDYFNMKIEFFHLFPTLVIAINNFISEEERLILLKEINNLEHHDHGALDNNSKSTFTPDNLLIDNLNDHVNLRRRIDLALNEYAQQYGIADLRLTNSWSNQQTIGSTLKGHRHPNSKVSGALYINVDENSSKLVFHNPNPYIYIDDFNNQTDTNYRAYWIQPENCQLILFPSWLEHSSGDAINNTENRTVISFNSAIINSDVI